MWKAKIAACSLTLKLPSERRKFDKAPTSLNNKNFVFKFISSYLQTLLQHENFFALKLSKQECEYKILFFVTQIARKVSSD